MDSRGTILVSGAGGGIGTAGCRRLAEAGFTVLAGTHSETDAKALDGLHPNIRPLSLDVTREESIRAAMARAQTMLGAERLAGCWSNAGIMRIAALANLATSDLRAVIDVNLTGAILFLQAALPLLERGRARIVITGSATGMFAGPAVGAYTATKWGLEGFADALRIEMTRAGITVSLLQPGLVKTPMATAATPDVEHLVARMDQRDREDYEKLVRVIASTSAKASTLPEQVAGAVLEALTAPRPRSRYRVGADSKAVAVLRHLPDGARDFLQRKLFGL